MEDEAEHEEEEKEYKEEEAKDVEKPVEKKKLTLQDYQSEQKAVQEQIEGLRQAFEAAKQQLGNLIVRNRELTAVIEALTNAQEEA